MGASRERPLRANLPPIVTLGLILVTVYAFFFELIPAMGTYRQAKSALAAQIAGYDNLVADRDEKAKLVFSLANDPQATEHALDEKGLVPAQQPADR